MKGKFIQMETKAFDKLVERVSKKLIESLEPKNKSIDKKWISAQEAKQLLCIKSTGKLNRLVRDKHISASQHGRTIVYCKKSILDFLDKNKIS